MKKSINFSKVIFIMGILLLILINLTACQQTTNTRPNNNNSDDEEILIDQEFDRILGVIKNVDTANRRLFVYDIENEKLVTLNIDGSVVLQNKFGEPITLQQFKMGDMVRTKYEINTLVPEQVQITAQVWEFQRVSNVIVNKENQTVQRGNDHFKYTDEVLVLYNGIPIEITDVTPNDQVTLKGYRDKVWVIILDSGHGFIELKNHEYFIDGIIEVGSNIMEVIKSRTRIPVPVGVHRIVIDKPQHDPVIREVMIEKDQVVILDLGRDVPREGDLKINLAQSDVKVYINGKRFDDLSNPIRLPFGVYVIVAEKEGYLRYEDSINFNQPQFSYPINLEKQEQQVISNYMHVNSPSNVELYLNGDYIGMIPVSIPIKPGNHSITLRREGYFSKLYTVEILDNGKDSFFTFPELVKIQSNTEGNSENVNETNVQE